MERELRAEILLAAALLVFVMTAMGVVAVPAKPAHAGEGSANPVRLFGTVEFRTSPKVLPRWQRIRELAPDQVAQLAEGEAGGLPRAIKKWRLMLAEARSESEMEQIKTVNRFFNRWPYRLDREVYGVADFWATPEEFMIHSGDCEDYGISKYFTLRRLGVPAARLRLVVVQDRIRGIGHAVLAVYLDDAVYILDNLTDQVLPHTRYRHYLPQYSVNEVHAWAHLSLKAGKAFVDPPAPGNTISGKDP